MKRNLLKIVLTMLLTIGLIPNMVFVHAEENASSKGRTITYYVDKTKQQYPWGGYLTDCNNTQWKLGHYDGKNCTYDITEDEKYYKVEKTFDEDYSGAIKAEGCMSGNLLLSLFNFGVGNYRFVAFNTEADGSGTWYRAGEKLPDSVNVLYAQAISKFDFLSVNLTNGASNKMYFEDTESQEKDIYVNEKGLSQNTLDYKIDFIMGDDIAKIAWGRIDKLIEDKDKTYVDLSGMIDERLTLNKDKIKVTFVGGFTPLGANDELLEPVSEGSTTYDIPFEALHIDGNTFRVRTVLTNATIDQNDHLKFSDFKNMSLIFKGVEIPEELSQYASSKEVTDKEDLSFIKSEGKISVRVTPRDYPFFASTQTQVVEPIYAQILKTHKVIVNYLDKETNEAIKDAVVLSGNEEFATGKEYDVTHLVGGEIEGYVFDNTEGEVKGKLSDDVVINCYYSKKVELAKRTITIQYVDKATNQQIKESIVLSGDEYKDGANYNINDKVNVNIEGYTFDSTQGEVSGTLNGDVTVVCYYVKDSEPVTPVVPETPTQPDDDLNSDVLGDKVENEDKKPSVNVDKEDDTLNSDVLGDKVNNQSKNKTETKNVKTSDDQEIMIYMIVGIVALIGVSILVRRKKWN